jgi:hypothetical protein
MFRNRATPLAGALSMIAGSAAAEVTHLLASNKVTTISSKLAVTWWQAIAAFVVDALVLIVVSLVTKPKPEPDDELPGLVWGIKRPRAGEPRVAGDEKWYRSPALLAGCAVVLIVALNIIFIEESLDDRFRATTAVQRAITPSTGETDVDEVAAAQAANRFDIRRIIGGLFAVYGVILIVTGIVGSHHVKTKAAGINIDLWTGIAMAIFAGFVISWTLLRPVAPEPEERRGEGSRRLRRAPAT